MSELYTQFDNIFFEKTRLSIMTIIASEQKVTFTMLKEKLGGSDGGLYSHIEKLVKSGYITKKKELAGDVAQTVYSITREGSKTFSNYLNFIELILKKEVENN